MDKTELLKILVNNSKVWVKDEKDQDKAMIYVDDFVNELLEAINYTRCCKSDSNLLCDKDTQNKALEALSKQAQDLNMGYD